jgi:hypothetical protein
MGKKLKRYPPKPKEKASLAVWESYFQKIKDIDRENADKIKDINRKKTVVKSVNEHIKRSFVKPRARKSSTGMRVSKVSGWF